MTPAELIQLIRTCNLNQVREELEKTQVMIPDHFTIIAKFYKRAAQQPK